MLSLRFSEVPEVRSCRFLLTIPGQGTPLGSWSLRPTEKMQQRPVLFGASLVDTGLCLILCLSCQARVKDLEDQCRSQTEQFSLLSQELKQFRLQTGKIDLLTSTLVTSELPLALCSSTPQPPWEKGNCWRCLQVLWQMSCYLCKLKGVKETVQMCS